MIVSVIVPVFNRVQLVKASIQSLLQQRGDFAIDVIVVDDGSTEGTGELLSMISDEDMRVRVFSQMHSGIAAARNTGLANIHPDAKFVSFLDSDDLCIPGRFKRDLAILAKRPDLAATYGRALVSELGASPREAEVVTIHVGCSLIRKEALVRIGPFDTRFHQGEDTDFLFRLFESGLRVMQTQTCCLNYRRHSGNITRQSDASRRFFKEAINESLKRRANDASIRLHVPKFDLSELRTSGLYSSLDSIAVEKAISELADGRVEQEREDGQNDQCREHQIGFGAPIGQQHKIAKAF